MRHSILLVLGLCVASTAARAQTRHESGGWLTLGLGTGSANIVCDGCARGGKLTGPTLIAGVAVMLTPRVGVGLSLDEWWRSPSDTENTNTSTLMVHYYPAARGHAFAEAGVGLSRAAVLLDGDRVAEGRQWAFMAAVGYDIYTLPVPDGYVTVTPRVSYTYSPIGNLRYAPVGAPWATGWRHQVLSIGAGLGLRFSEPTRE